MSLEVKEVKNRDLKGVTANYTEGQIAQKITDAEAMIVDTFGTIVETRISSGLLSKVTYARIVADMVLRVLTDPEGIQSESDGSYSYTRSSFGGTPDLWIPDKDAALLTGETDGLPSTIYTSPQTGWWP